METDEPLESGYGPDTPPGDNACNDYVRGLVAGYGGLARARGDRVAEDPDLLMTDGRSPSLFTSIAVLRRPLDVETWETMVERAHAFYGQREGGSFLLFSAWPTPDLTTRGFGRIGHPPLMLRSPASLTIDATEGLKVRPVQDETTARDWEWAIVHGFPLEDLQPFEPGRLLPVAALDAPGWRHWVGYLDREPVSTASLHVSENQVNVEFVCTTEAARGQGIGRALTATVTGAVADRPAMLIASDPGRPIYERLGFRAILRFTLWAGHRRPVRSGAGR